MDCEYSTCLNKASAEICLDNGECFYTCEYHITPMILSVAETSNPVHYIEPLEEENGITNTK